MLTRLRIAIAGVGVLLLWAPPVFAVISQAFKTDQTLVAGSIVSLAGASNDTVVAATEDNDSRLLGAVVDQKLPNQAEGLVQVATSGQVPVLVSTLNGDIKAGDRVGTTPIAGVGAKAISGRAIGIAQADFSQNSPGAAPQDVRTASGQTRRIFAGAIIIVIEPAKAENVENTFVPESAQNFFDSLAGKPVAPTRIILAATIVILTLVFVSIMISTAVRSSITAIGRNPLTKQTVAGSLFRVLAVAFLVTAGSLGISYLIIAR